MKDETKLDDFSRVAKDKTWPPRKYVIEITDVAILTAEAIKIWQEDKKKELEYAI